MKTSSCDGVVQIPLKCAVRRQADLSVRLWTNCVSHSPEVHFAKRTVTLAFNGEPSWDM